MLIFSPFYLPSAASFDGHLSLSSSPPLTRSDCILFLFYISCLKWQINFSLSFSLLFAIHVITGRRSAVHVWWWTCARVCLRLWRWTYLRYCSSALHQIFLGPAL